MLSDFNESLDLVNQFQCEGDYLLAFVGRYVSVVILYVL